MVFFFMKYFKYLLAVVCIFLSSITLADNVFIFSTEPQSIPVGQMSSKINVQAENPVSETTYLVLTSSSPTGQFLNSSGNPLTSAYISSGDSNRAVYYKDSTAGDFVISADILNKDKTKITTISQHIFVGSVTDGSNPSNSETASTTSSELNKSDTNSSESGLSSHSAPVSLSDSNEKIDFKISAGRDRLTSVGGSILFKAVLTDSKNIPENNVSFIWSFGDGTSERGNNIFHFYRFAGEYTVVVNAYYLDFQAVSKIKIKVINPVLVIKSVDGGLEIRNNSGVEINLEKWSLVGSQKTFIFPLDTIIPASGKVIFAKEVTGISSEMVWIENPLGKKYAEASENHSDNKLNNMEIEKDISLKLKEAEKSLLSLVSQVGESRYEITKVDNESKISPNSNGEVLGESIEASSTQEKNQNSNQIVYEAPQTRGLVSKIFVWPIKGFDFIKKLFTE